MRSILHYQIVITNLGSDVVKDLVGN